MGGLGVCDYSAPAKQCTMHASTHPFPEPSDFPEPRDDDSPTRLYCSAPSHAPPARPPTCGKASKHAAGIRSKLQRASVLPGC